MCGERGGGRERGRVWEREREREREREGERETGLNIRLGSKGAAIMQFILSTKFNHGIKLQSSRGERLKSAKFVAMRNPPNCME